MGSKVLLPVDIAFVCGQSKRLRAARGINATCQVENKYKARSATSPAMVGVDLDRKTSSVRGTSKYPLLENS